MLSVVIVNWNTRDFLKTCLGSLFRQSIAQDLEVIVVDNASSDGSAEMVRAEFPNARLIASEVNLGYALGNDRGLAESTGDWILLLNPDTVLESPTLIERARAKAADIPNLGYLGVRLVGLEDETQPSVRPFPTYRGLMGMALGLSGAGTGRDFDYTRDGPAEQPMGTFLLFPRAALTELGPLDRTFGPEFPIFFNDVDLLKRIHDRGRVGWYLAEPWVRHVGGAGTRQVKKKMIWESHRSLVRYMAKHERKGLQWGAWLTLAAVSPVVAFLRARGYDPGFRPPPALALSRTATHGHDL